MEYSDPGKGNALRPRDAIRIGHEARRDARALDGRGGSRLSPAAREPQDFL
jgi:hypothetical protein